MSRHTRARILLDASTEVKYLATPGVRSPGYLHNEDVTRKRLDQRLVALGLAPSRAKARELVLSGRIRAGDRPATKPSMPVDESTLLSVEPGVDFVSRGGRKLLGALDDLGIDPSGLTCVDVGASTGGFTECLLERGASKVYAVDVGRDLLDRKLRANPRVVVRDGENARSLRADLFDEPIDLVVVDASFISIEKLLPALARTVRPAGHVLALVKPQFEQGAARARRTRGVVRDAEERERLIAGARQCFADHGLIVDGEHDSRVAGPKGNVERFVHARRAR